MFILKAFLIKNSTFIHYSSFIKSSGYYMIYLLELAVLPREYRRTKWSYTSHY